MTMVSHLRRPLPAAISRCYYERNSCSTISIYCSRNGLESHIRQISTATPIHLQSPLSVPLFPSSSNDYKLTCIPNQHRNKFYIIDESKDNCTSRDRKGSWDMRFQELVEYKYKKEHGDTIVPRSYPNNPQLANWVNKQRQEYNRKLKGEVSQMTDERIDELNKIGFVWDPLDDAWNERLQQLVEYTKEHGDTLVPKNYPNNPQLARWVNKQRVEYNRKLKGEVSQMTDERIDELNKIGFVWDPLDDAWNERLQQLVDYVKEHGDTLVPKNYPNNPQLARWVSTQRKEYNRKLKGEVSQMTDERIDELNKIGFVWDPLDDAWNERLQQLVEYMKEHGDTLVPQNYPNNPQLARWVSTQRVEYNRKLKGEVSQMTDERIDELNKIGFVWDPLDDTWNERLQQLVDYEKEHDDTLVPKNYPNNPQLARWVNNQRVEYNRKLKGEVSQMTDERIDELNKIGFVWDPLDDAWNERLQQLVDYVKEHGDTLVPKNYPNNPQLANWVSTQRKEYNRKLKGVAFQMTDKRIDELNKIGFVWDPLDDAWNERLQQLVDYEKEHGDTLVPRSYPNNPQLANWVNKQRQEYNRKLKGEVSQMTDERIDELNKIGFVWDPLDDTWNERLQQLVEYMKEHGDTLVPRSYPNNPQLANWVNKQRVEYNRKLKGEVSQMTDERIDELNKIGFVWDAPEAAWQSKYDKLHSFYKEYGHTKVPFGDQARQEMYDWCMRQRYRKAKGRLEAQRYDQLKMINLDLFTREVARSSQIECMFFYELERMGHEFDMLNKVFFDVRLRPDGVIFQNESVIFVEIDERYHSRYPVKRELGRMVSLWEEAVVKGYDQIIFVRIGTGYQKKVDEGQLKFVSSYLHKLKSNVQPHRFSVHYIDYPDSHHHVLASKENFEDVYVKYSQ